MATEIKTPRYTPEQREAWQKAKYLLKHARSSASRRALHIAMSELRAEQGRKHKGPIETPAKHEGKLIEYKAILIRDSIAARVAEWKQFLRDPGSKKLFIIVDPSLSPAQKAVQAAHCAAEFQKQHPHAPWINGTMVLLEPEGDVPLDRFAQRLWWVDYQTAWTEPDMDDQLTAIALLSDFRNQDIGKGKVRLI